MTQRLPLLAILLGVAGLIPFIVFGIGAVIVDPYRARFMFWGLMGWSAVVLSFTGAVHWGFALAFQEEGNQLQTPEVERRRLLLGVVPALIGWGALLTVIGLPAWVGLLIMIAGYVVTASVENRAARRGLVPTHYVWLRYALTALVIAMLITVTVLRVLAQHVVLF